MFEFIWVCSLQTEARPEESFVLRVFNPDYHPSDEEMCAILRKADLESHGYTKELTSSLTSRENTTNLTYEKRHFYYRTVDCSRAQEVAQELETLLPGNRSSFAQSLKKTCKFGDISEKLWDHGRGYRYQILAALRTRDLFI